VEKTEDRPSITITSKPVAFLVIVAATNFPPKKACKSATLKALQTVPQKKRQDYV